MLDPWSKEYKDLMEALAQETPEEKAKAYKERELKDRIEAAKRREKENDRQLSKWVQQH